MFFLKMRMNVNFEMDKRRFELESQLHNQYAENFNSHVGAFVSIYARVLQSIL